CIAILLTAGLMLAGCSDSTEHKLLQAEMYTKANQPDKALEMADAVLESDLKAENGAAIRERALVIKAHSHLALNQLDQSRQVLEQMKADKPDDPEPVRSMIRWAMKSMDMAVNK